MKTMHGLLIAAGLLSTPAIANDKDVLSTPPVFPGTSLQCIAANVGKATVDLYIQMYDESGNVPFDETCQLPPGSINVGGSLCAVLEGAPRAGWCKFTVTSGRRQDVRAAICAVDANLGIGAAPSCLPAQGSFGNRSNPTGD